MPILSFLENKKEDVVLLINVHNGDINTALVSFSKDKKPLFLYNLNSSFVGEKPEMFKLTDGASRFLNLSLKEAIKKGWKNIQKTNKSKKISHVVLSISSPWFFLKTKEVNLSQEVPFIISKRFLDDVLLKEEEIFKKELSKSHSGDTKQKFNIIEKSIIHTKINGYEVSVVLGKKAKNFNVSILISATAKEVYEKILDLILKETHISEGNILINSFPIILFHVVRDYLGNYSDFVLFNVGAEMTDVVLVKNDIIHSITFFPFGRNTIIRHIASYFKISTEIAESQLFLFLSNKIDDSLVESMQKQIIDLEKEWSVYLENALLELSPQMIWPKKAFIFADKKTSSIFVDFINLEKVDATVNFRKNLDLTEIKEEKLLDFYTNNTKTGVDESLVILSLFHNRIINDK